MRLPSSKLLLALAGTVASAGLYATTFPPLAWRPLAWICLVPFFLALRGAGLWGGAGVWGAAGLGWLWALVGSMALADALPRSVEHYFQQSKLLSYGLSLWVWTFTGCIYYMGFAAAYRALARRTTLALPLLAGCAWAGFEFLRGWLLTGSGFFVGNPWALSAYSQAGGPAVAQIASVTGVYGISFLIGAVNAALAEALRELWAGRRLRRPTAAGLALSLGLTAGVFAWGASELQAGGEEGTPEVPVAIVQGNVDMGTTWRASHYGKNLERYLRLTHRSFQEGDPSIVFWPEGALSFYLGDEPIYQRAIGRSLRLGGAELIVGGPRKSEAASPAAPAGEAQESYYNAVFVVDEAGRIRDSYEKEVLLPFAEFFPLRSLDFLRRRFERVRVFQPGRRIEPVETRAGRAGVLICLEALLPEIAARRVRAGAEYLVSPSNDSWIEDERWALRMLDLVSLRAIEQRRYFVRASTSGPSAIVDPWGRQQVRSAAFQQAMLLGSIRPRRELSLYARLGDAFAALCLASVAGRLVWDRRRRAREARGASAAAGG